MLSFLVQKNGKILIFVCFASANSIIFLIKKIR
jgi:hypothetical protein